jgi:hypothetical protein
MSAKAHQFRKRFGDPSAAFDRQNLAVAQLIQSTCKLCPSAALPDQRVCASCLPTWLAWKSGKREQRRSVAQKRLDCHSHQPWAGVFA